MKFLIVLILLGVVDCFDLTIIHNNDIHSYFDEVTPEDGRSCTERRMKNQTCFGGFARLLTVVEKTKNNSENEQVLFLNGGDNYVGTPWFTLYQEEVVSLFMNLIHLDIQTLGNHDFDYGPELLRPYLINASFPTVCANVDVSKEPLLEGLIKPSHIFNLTNGKKVGVIGYILPDTSFISSPGNTISFTDEIDALTEEAEKLKDEVDVILVLGHSGYYKDMEIAEKVPYIHAVIGAHSHTFLYSGNETFPEEPEGPYPTVIPSSIGQRNVPVVQAYCNCKYVGVITFTFDDITGELTDWNGSPIYLDSSIESDPEMQQLLEEFRAKVDNVTNVDIGSTLVYLNGERNEVRTEETNLGNFVADALLYAAYKNHTPTEGCWSPVTGAIQNSGGIRASISQISSNGLVTLEDAMLVFPFGNTIDIIEIEGRYLREAFEHSVSGIATIEGRFLQIAGFQVTYNLSREIGNRVSSIQALCSNCSIPVLEPLEDDQLYNIILPGYVRKGGDGFFMIQENSNVTSEAKWMDLDILSDYITMQSPIIQGLEGRIVFDNSTDDIPDDPDDPGHAATFKLHLHLFMAIIVFNLFFQA